PAPCKGQGAGTKGSEAMKFPKISLDQIPGLETAQALFGSVMQAGGQSDDRIVDIMVFLYEIIPPPPPPPVF
ncbi:MAG TPA: hypothetical protein VK913_04415, partial [Erythrobacter sp.]|nr:hypothetical protein [Erythrobacter sp.]